MSKKSKKLTVQPEMVKPICGLSMRSMIVSTAIALGTSIKFALDGNPPFAEGQVTRIRKVTITENQFEIHPEVKGAKPYAAGNLDGVAESQGFKNWGELRSWLKKHFNLTDKKPITAYWIDFDNVSVSEAEEKITQQVASFTAAKEATSAPKKEDEAATEPDEADAGESQNAAATDSEETAAK